MRESMARLTPEFSANRTVREYTEKHYLPAAAAYCRRAADNGKFGAGLLEWKRALGTHWSNLRFGGVQVETREQTHAFEVQVYLDELLDVGSVKAGSDSHRAGIYGFSARGGCLGFSSGGTSFGRLILSFVSTAKRLKFVSVWL